MLNLKYWYPITLNNSMYFIKIKALGLDYFNKVSKHLDSENIPHTISYDNSLRSKMFTMYAHRTNNIDKNEYWSCYGYNENRLAISQLAESYFPKSEHSCACNLVFPHSLIKFNQFKKGYIDSFVKYLTNYGLGENYYKTPMDYISKKIFSVLTIPVESPLQYGRYKEILQQNRIQGMVCYGDKMKTEVYSGYAQIDNGAVYYFYGVGEFAPTIEAMAKIYFDNLTQLSINNLPKNNFCIRYSDVIKGSIYGFDEILIRSGVKLITQSLV